MAYGGTSILARFKPRPQFVGINIHQLTDSPCTDWQNKLTCHGGIYRAQKFILEGKGNHQEKVPVNADSQWEPNWSLMKLIQEKFTKPTTNIRRVLMMDYITKFIVL